MGNRDQSVFGEPAYPSVEAKAAHLLYFVIKNHPFSDGNKHSAEPVINDVRLAALTLLVAESDPANKDTMIRLTMNMLAQEGE